MKVRYYSQLADAKDYPQSKVSMHPSLSLDEIRFNEKPSDSSYFLNSNINFYQARYALLYALRKLDINKNASVLVPAYHCRSMVEPAEYLGADVLFFSISSCLEYDLQEIDDIVIKAKNNVKALILPHYFGLPQKIAEIKIFCESKGIVLIEDCAHSLYGELEGRKLGSFGDFSIASPRKFLPVEHSGLLKDNRNTDENPPSLNSVPNITNIKILAKLLYTTLCKRKTMSRIDVNTMLETPESSSSAMVKTNVEYETGVKYLEEDKKLLAGSMVIKWLANHLCHSDYINARLDNYHYLDNALKDIDGCHALFSNFPNGAVPYVFPLVIDKYPEETFHELKRRGVPLLRWEDMAITNCRISSFYRKSLVQIPCHQSLNNNQLEWIVQNLHFVFKK